MQQCGAGLDGDEPDRPGGRIPKVCLLNLEWGRSIQMKLVHALLARGLMEAADEQQMAKKDDFDCTEEKAEAQDRRECAGAVFGRMSEELSLVIG